MSSLDFDETLARGVAAHKERRLEEALNFYQAALTMAPADPEANSLMGLALAQSDRSAEAGRYLRHAVNLDPEVVGFRMNLVEGLIAAADYAGARRELQAVLVRVPRHARAQERFGDVAALEGDGAAAAAAWTRAQSFDAHYLPPVLKLAKLAAAERRFADADALLDGALVMTPGDPSIFSLRGEIAMDRRDWARLAEIADEWCKRQPKNADAWRAMARAAVQLGRPAIAIDAYHRVVQMAGPMLPDLTALAGVLLQSNDFNGASAVLLAAETIDAKSPQLLAQRAQLHVHLGQYAEAEACCRACLAVAPDFVPALSLLGKLQRGRLSETELATALSIAHRPDVTLEAAIPAAFAGAHALEARGDFRGAFAAFERAHALAITRDQLDGRGYDHAAEARRVALIESLPVATAGSAQVMARPLFLVGMPGSGTEAVEALLGMHSGIVNCAEHATLAPILAARLALADAGLEPQPHTLDEWRAAYRVALPRIDREAAIIDKHPFNYAAIGLIHRLFPDAIIVHVHRDPLETCLAIWRNEAPKSWTFAHRFADLAHFYANYARLMAHWDRVLPGRVVSLKYEAFVADPRGVGSAMLAACGFKVDDTTLSGRVSPAAAGSTRGPAIDLAPRTRDYAEHITALSAALEAARVR